MPYRLRIWALIACCLTLTPLFAQLKPVLTLDDVAADTARVGARTWIDEGEVTAIAGNTPTITFTCLDSLLPGDRLLLFTAGPVPDRVLVAEAMVVTAARERLCTARVTRSVVGETPGLGQHVALVPAPPIIGVLNFTRPNGAGTLLGQQLAEKLAAYLQQQVADTEFQVLEPFRVRQVLTNNRLNEADLFDPRRLSPYAKLPPVRLVVAGTVSVVGEEIWIDARLVDAISERQLNTLRVSCPASRELLKLFESPSIIPAPEPVLTPDLIVALRQLVLTDREVQNILRGPAGPTGPQGAPGSFPEFLPMLRPEETEQVRRMLDTFGPVMAELRRELKALAERVAKLEPVKEP